jgi:hypothetical protein
MMNRGKEKIRIIENESVWSFLHLCRHDSILQSSASPPRLSHPPSPSLYLPLLPPSPVLAPAPVCVSVRVLPQRQLYAGDSVWGQGWRTGTVTLRWNSMICLPSLHLATPAPAPVLALDLLEHSQHQAQVRLLSC